MATDVGLFWVVSFTTGFEIGEGELRLFALLLVAAAPEAEAEDAAVVVAAYVCPPNRVKSPPKPEPLPQIGLIASAAAGGGCCGC